MRTALIITLVLALAVIVAPAARAADDGNTQLKLSSGYLYYPNDTYDVINTSGTGNVKGIRCTNVSAPFTLQLTVNGGTTQSFTNVADTGADSLWIPMNIRFTSSVHVRLVNGTSYQAPDLFCQVSWGLD
jgi:hypothetical protein